MKKFKLTQGYYAIVDDQDYDDLLQWSWQISGNGYAKRGSRSNGKCFNVFMHRYLMQPPDGMDIDHINHNKLDNRRSNLRVVTRSQNMLNIRTPITNTSGHKGVSWHKAGRKWMAEIHINYKNHYLGLFENIEDAIAARKAAELELAP